MPRSKTFDKQIVLNSAMQLFWKKGFHATSMQDLVDHLGVNRASLYSTYGDKEQLFTKALLNYKEQSRRGMSCYFENQPSIKAGFKTLFTDAVKDSVADKDRKGCFAVNTTAELIPGDEDKNLRALAAYLFMFFSGLQIVAKVEASKAKLTRSVEVALSALD